MRGPSGPIKSVADCLEARHVTSEGPGSGDCKSRPLNMKWFFIFCVHVTVAPEAADECLRIHFVTPVAIYMVPARVRQAGEVCIHFADTRSK